MADYPPIPTHVAVIPSPGIGHLSPMLRLTSTLSSPPYNLQVTLVITLPIISNAESHEISTFFSIHPHISRLDFHLPPSTPSSNPAVDPFLVQYVAFSNSIHLISPSLSVLTPPITAIFSDVLATKGINSTDIGIPNYTVTTSSARFTALLTSLPHLSSKPTSNNVDIGIPGIDLIPTDTIPPPFFNPDHIFTRMLIESSELLHRSSGIVINTFDFLEREIITALAKSQQHEKNLPPVFAIGPLQRRTTVKSDDGNFNFPPWLNNQPAKSVLYVSFGSRTAMSRDQIRELGEGLCLSGCRFLWVMKTSTVDKEEEGKDPDFDLIGVENTTNGLVLREWVNQEEILAHPSIGGFVSHCGWNSVTEAARYGVPVLAWPQHGDQRVNASVVEKAGLGIWDREWGWGGGRLIGGDEIAEKVKELMMENGELRRSAGRVREEGEKACGYDGSSRNGLMKIVESLSCATSGK